MKRSFAFIPVFLFYSAVFAQTWNADSPEILLPTKESLLTRKTPEWFHDAKLGIFIHWGLYSVPAWAPPIGEPGSVDWPFFYRNNPYAEWYMNTMKFKDSPTWKHHVETYGADFSYFDFADVFNREVLKWDPGRMAEIFADAGARYVVITTKHHDGFLLWPSEVPYPGYQPHDLKCERDLVGELGKEVREKGMRYGVYYSGLDWTFYRSAIGNLWPDVRLSIPQSVGYAMYMDAQYRELIMRYKPDILWNDSGYPKHGDVLGLIADYYNHFPEGVVNNRWGLEYRDIADFETPEYNIKEDITAHKWETCRGIGFSFGYNRQENDAHYLSPDELIDMFADIVSKNGNLLLNVGPEADGSIPVFQLERLRALGRWLKKNGEAIYGTRPWIRPASSANEKLRVRFTTKGNALYVILLDIPSSGDLTIENLTPPENATVELLSTGKKLKWEYQRNDLTVKMPDTRDARYALTIRITPKP